ncbi:MAG TPA: glycoside hydrolase family 15 protein [Hyphomicrobium sp.]|nr:glycoside hydrolase family 15 protein [Hyphomicrobium sp.]
MRAKNEMIDCRCPLPIEDYGLIGDCTTAALVGRDGSIDWLCWPRFDSAACFAALLGDTRHGRWSIGPKGPYEASRRYCGNTAILETTFRTAEGSVALIDFMPVGGPASSVVRIIEGRTGSVPMRMLMTLRFDYGSSVPWVTRLDEANVLTAIAGPNLAVLRSPIALHGENLSTVGDFTIKAKERIGFCLSFGPSHLAPPAAFDIENALQATLNFWNSWASLCTYRGPHCDAVLRSLLTLKMLSYSETGGIIAAPTTSLPEFVGGKRNWDYRYCWVRDATLSLIALMGAGYFEEAKAWCNWLQRAVAGSPDALQIMYGLSGERRLTELGLPWLPGYRRSHPVRVGNAASSQLQLDVWGELMDALHVARESGLAPVESAWALQIVMLEHLEEIWRRKDAGIWETRGVKKHFTFSKVMAWVAFDRSIRDAEKFGLSASIDRWRSVRAQIYSSVCRDGYNERLGFFTQSYEDDDVDASLLLIPIVGFLPVHDPRVKKTVQAIEANLLRHALVARYRTELVDDGLPPGEGAFLPCSFWLVDVYLLQGEEAKAKALFERLLSLRNDLGLLSEEYDSRNSRLLGNFPQAFSHFSLIQTALTLYRHKPAAKLVDARAECHQQSLSVDFDEPKRRMQE